MPDMAPIIIILLIAGLAGGLFWAFGPKKDGGTKVQSPEVESSAQTMRSGQPSTALDSQENGNGLARLWTLMGALGALGWLVLALVAFASGQTLLGVVSVILSPFIALGPMTIAYAIRWSMRVEAMLTPKAD
jgi:hypothetical protein